MRRSVLASLFCFLCVEFQTQHRFQKKSVCPFGQRDFYSTALSCGAIAASLYLRQDLRAPRKSRLRRQFLNSLRSNKRNFDPPQPTFSSCRPAYSNKSLKYNDRCLRNLPATPCTPFKTRALFFSCVPSRDSDSLVSSSSRPPSTHSTPVKILVSLFLAPLCFGSAFCTIEFRFKRRQRKNSCISFPQKI